MWRRIDFMESHYVEFRFKMKCRTPFEASNYFLIFFSFVKLQPLKNFFFVNFRLTCIIWHLKIIWNFSSTFTCKWWVRKIASGSFRKFAWKKKRNCVQQYFPTGKYTNYKTKLRVNEAPHMPFHTRIHTHSISSFRFCS